jgi:sec-independent protein translocase protein TatA
MHLPIFLAFIPSGMQMFVIALIGLLLFGKRLPEVGRSLGKGIVEFKKGLHGVEDEFTSSVEDHSSKPKPLFDPYTGKPIASLPIATPNHKFDPYTGKPIEQVGETTVSSPTEKVG